MLIHDSILPFVGDRDAFGHWLSGFTDGEGHFCLGYGGSKKSKCPVAVFGITLRDDDIEILRTIRSFLGCGQLHLEPKRGKSNPRVRFLIWRKRDLVKAIISQFERYPLRAKKALDFDIWKEGVNLAHNVTWRTKRSAGLHKGTRPRWSQTDREAFHKLKLRLQEGRKYPNQKRQPIEDGPPDLFTALREPEAAGSLSAASPE